FVIGMVSVVLLSFYIKQEIDTDSFHENSDRIYRVLRKAEVTDRFYHIGYTSAPFAPALKNDFPDIIKETTRVMFQDGLVAYEDKSFFEPRIALADDNFFTFFSFPLAYGDPRTVLDKPNTVVLTQEMAAKYFGEENPLGKILTIDNELKFEVTGVLDKFPAKSHIQFDFMISLDLFKNYKWFSGWWNNNLVTYAMVDTREQAQEAQRFFPEFMTKYFGDSPNRTTGLLLEPFADTYFNNDTQFDPVVHGDMNNIYILSAVGLAILFIACFNYVNLSIAMAFKKASQVGIRKVLGSRKRRLIMQHVSETLVLVMIGSSVSVMVSYWILPFFNQQYGLEVEISWLSTEFFLFVILLVICATILSGVYPSWLIASFNPLKTMKGKIFTNHKNLFLRKGLVVTQFAISIFMIIATLVIARQLQFVNDIDLGFDQDAIVLVPENNNEISSKDILFKDRLRAHPTVRSVTAATGEPGGFHDATIIELDDREDNVRTRTLFSDYHYLQTFDIQLVAGRDFDDRRKSEMNEVVILNESLSRELGWEPQEAIGKRIFLPMFDSLKREVIGVVSDFHFVSLKKKIEPLVICLSESDRLFAIKMDGANLQAGLNELQHVWDELVPGFPLQYRFLDDKLAALYANEAEQRNVFTAFASISVFLSCLGIFGLISFTAQDRKKEIGVRKVLGADIRQIVSLLSKEFVLMVSISSIIAIPGVYFFLSKWLEDFAYRIDLIYCWYLFLGAVILTLFLALLTIAYQAIRAAVANPVESLRYE
ncbi:MAG: ABC transporter permease, partial [Cyclobacteriaceae bacterium]|nr:ABC transporter permease [Cyclobacteriaceae bacterium HetDA_MAG_MS6]